MTNDQRLLQYYEDEAAKVEAFALQVKTFFMQARLILNPEETLGQDNAALRRLVRNGFCEICGQPKYGDTDHLKPERAGLCAHLMAQFHLEHWDVLDRSDSGGKPVDKYIIKGHCECGTRFTFDPDTREFNFAAAEPAN